MPLSTIFHLYHGGQFMWGGNQSTEQQCENICLIPELCYLTGLTDELRSDFRVMKVSLLTSNNISSCTQYNIMYLSLSVTCDRSVVFSKYSGFLHQ
jgi:hypothetical protein